jgi:hypothetical protein
VFRKRTAIPAAQRLHSVVTCPPLATVTNGVEAGKSGSSVFSASTSR